MSYSGTGSISITFSGSTSGQGTEHTVTVASDGDDAKAYSEAHRAITQAQVEAAEAQAASRSTTPQAAAEPTADAPEPTTTAAPAADDGYAAEDAPTA